MHGTVSFEREARAKRDDALAAALRREGLELVATVTLEEIEHRMRVARRVRGNRARRPRDGRRDAGRER